MYNIVNNPWFPFSFLWSPYKWKNPNDFIIANGLSSGIFITLMFLLLFGILRIQD